MSILNKNGYLSDYPSESCISIKILIYGKSIYTRNFLFHIKEDKYLVLLETLFWLVKAILLEFFVLLVQYFPDEMLPEHV